MQDQSRVLDISWGTIIKLAVAALVVYLIFLVRNILVWVLFGLIVSVLFDPVIDFLQKKRVPRVVGTVGLYVLVFGFIAFIIYSTAPLFINEIQKFSQLFPKYLKTISPPLAGLGISAFADTQSFINAVVKGIEQFSSNLFSALFSIFGGIFSTIFVISIAIFLSFEERSVERFIAAFFPRRYEALALDLWTRSQKKVAGWFLSRIISSAFVGVLVYITLLLFNIQYPLTLGLASGILNFIPIVGPLVMGVLITLLVALDSVTKAIFVLLAFIAIQQVEGSIISPLLTKKIIGLPPALVLISLSIGGVLWGIMGAILAIPLAGILFEFLRDFLKKRKEEKTVAL